MSLKHIRFAPILLSFSSVVCLGATTLSIGTESRYITEGRDNTDGEGVDFAGISFSQLELDMAIWYGQSTFEDYKELNASLSKTWTPSIDSELTASYTFLNFDGDAPNDHEIGIEWLYPVKKNLSLLVSTVYSTGANGFYSSLAGQYELNIKATQLSPYVSIGFNNGYVPEEHSGHDHFVAGLSAERNFSQFNLQAHVSHTSALNARPEDTLINQTWYGLQLSYSFD